MLATSANAAVSLDANVIGYDEEFKIARLEVNGASLNVPSSNVKIGAKQRIKIFADDVSLTWDSCNKSTIDNQIPAKILDIRGTEPSQILAVLGLGHNGEGDKILARVTKRSWVTLGLEVGQSVFAQVKAVALVRRGV